MPSLAPAELIARLYADAVIIGDALGVVHSVDITGYRWDLPTSNGSRIRVSTHVTGAPPDAMKGERRDLGDIVPEQAGVIVVKQEEIIDGWHVQIDVFFRPAAGGAL